MKISPTQKLFCSVVENDTSSQPISRHSGSQFAVVPLNHRHTDAHLPAQRAEVSVPSTSVCKASTPQLPCKTTRLSSCYWTITCTIAAYVRLPCSK
jgi:hypothetical protein